MNSASSLPEMWAFRSRGSQTCQQRRDCMDTRRLATAARIGMLCADGILNYHTVVAVTGEGVNDPHLVKTTMGLSIDTLIGGMLKTGQSLRIISGNVLTGVRVHTNGFLRYPYRRSTVIEEGDHADEFMGWASLDPANSP